MNDMKKTLIFVAAAVVLAGIAAITTPHQVTPDAFFDQGEQFFPDFTDPNDARTLEVIDYDEESGTARPFKVTFKGGRWTIPSHHDYPADGADRLARTAASVIGITKDDFRTDNISDHEACGVIDPLDETNPSLKGRGQRVTIKGENDIVLADFIVGKAFEDREGFRLVRVPGQKRVYGVRMNIDVSTQFADWIESDLMKLEKDDIDIVVLKDYSIDERTGSLNQRGEISLIKDADGVWTATDIGADKEVDRNKANNLVRAIDELAIVGVRPKPEGISASLEQVQGGQAPTQAVALQLQSKGYYFTRDGRLVSNEGEVQVHSTDGVTYTLRFGEIVLGSGLAVTAGAEKPDPNQVGENRYLMITTSFDPAQFPEPPAPTDLGFESKPDSVWTAEDYSNKGRKAAHDRWSEKIAAGQARSDELQARFGPWYYVISSQSFDSLNLTREDLVVAKK